MRENPSPNSPLYGREYIVLWDEFFVKGLISLSVVTTPIHTGRARSSEEALMYFCASGGENFPVRRADWVGWDPPLIRLFYAFLKVIYQLAEEVVAGVATVDGVVAVGVGELAEVLVGMHEGFGVLSHIAVVHVVVG